MDGGEVYSAKVLDICELVGMLADLDSSIISASQEQALSALCGRSERRMVIFAFLL